MKRTSPCSCAIWIATALVVMAPPTWGQDGLGKATRSKPGPEQKSAGNPATEATGPLSEADYRTFAQSVVEACSQGELTALNALFDWDSLYKTMAHGWELPEEVIQGAFSGLKKGMSQEGGITGQIIDLSKKGGSLTYLRTRRSRGRQVVLFRMILPESGGINYYEFVPVRMADGQVRSVDMYIYASGEFLSETLRRTLLPMLSQQSRGFIDELLSGEKDFVKDYPELIRATQLMNQEKFAEALAILKKMRPETIKQKMVLLARLRAAQSVDDKEYAAVLEDFRINYANDPCLELISIDSYVLKKDYAGAVKAVNRLDRSVGGDPYLNVVRAQLTEPGGNLVDARRFAERAVEQEPTLAAGHLALLSYAVLAEKYEDVLARLKEIDQKVHLKFNDLSKVPFYAGFVASPQYAEWLAYLKSKDQPK